MQTSVDDESSSTQGEYMIKLAGHSLPLAEGDVVKLDREEYELQAVIEKGVDSPTTNTNADCADPGK